jgi:hypothetical protein
MAAKKTTTKKTTAAKKTVAKKAPAKKAVAKKKAAPVKKKAAFAGAPRGGEWITGPNDVYPLCGPVAVANSLLAATGVEVSNGDIERLYRAAGGHGDSGADLEDLLAVAAAEGLAGCLLAGQTVIPAGTSVIAPGLVLLLSLNDVPVWHAAATAADGRVISWGETTTISEMSARVEDAWSLTWQGGVT